MLAVSRDHRVPLGAGHKLRADELAAQIPGAGRQRVSCGPGSKGERLYDWALAQAGRTHQLLTRRPISDPSDLAFYLCWAPGGATLAGLVPVAGPGGRWRNASGPPKNETALDHYQIRKGDAWYRHVTLAMCALAWLAVTAASQLPPPGSPALSGGPGHCGLAREGGPACGRSHGLIPLTVNEIRKLHAIFRQPAQTSAHHLRWSHWRRRHQARARHCHYQRRRPRDR